MGVALSRGNVRVAKQLLNGPQIGAAVKKVRSEGVAKGMRMSWRWASSVEYPPHISRAEAMPSLVGKECPRQVVWHHFITYLKPSTDRIDRGLTKRYPPFFGPLPPYAQGLGAEVKGLDIEGAQLGDPKARAIENLEHGIIPTAPPHRLVWV